MVHDRRLFGRVLSHGTLGLGEAYMDGWWDCGQMDVMFLQGDPGRCGASDIRQFFGLAA